MASTYTVKELIDTTKSGLRAIGYRDDLLQEDYKFADPLTPSYLERKIELAAFAQEPLSYRSACFGVAVLDRNGSDGAEKIQRYQALGAPQVLALYPGIEEVHRWKIVARGKPELIERIDPAHLQSLFLERQAEWGPEQVLRAKSIGFRSAPSQLDFFDAGLIPTIEDVVQKKLDELLREVIAGCQELYLARHKREPDYRALFGLVFRLMTAKLLADRGYPGGNWDSSDPRTVIEAVEAFYFRDMSSEQILPDRAVQQAAWDNIRTAFHFSNISVETLAYIYENTLVSPETRRKYDVHATPPEIAEYIVRSLPFEELPQDQRRVFEPFAGHAPFLIASLGRLRMLLPPDISQAQRHEYFVRMLSGMEIDSFARVVALNSLSLADYPSPDGWRIVNADAFTSPDFDTYLKQAQIVLCNPPFRDFAPDVRQAHLTIQATNKAVEALRRVLQHPPQMLGFVLPRVFVNGQSYRDARQRLAAQYKDIDVVGLPDITFRYSETEPVLVIAHGVREKHSRLRSSSVKREDYRQFIHTGKPTWQTEAPSDYLQKKTGFVFWYSPLQRILGELAYLPRLEEIAEVHRGIEYNVPLRKDWDRLISDTPKPRFAPGLVNVQPGFEPYNIHSFVYLNLDTDLMRTHAHLLPWDKPKVIANASRKSRYGWVIVGAVDYQGLVCYQQFHGVWPKQDIPVEVLASILNGPVANTFVSSYRTSRHNQVRTVRQIPVPQFTAAQMHSIASLVKEYRSYREQWLTKPYDERRFEHHCREIVWQIDAELLAAYDLSPRFEREILDHFAGHERPGPISFDRYYPSDFRPAVPWRVYISEELRTSTAQRTLERLPVLNDPVISEVVRDLED
jgi:hypothetical protein